MRYKSMPRSEIKVKTIIHIGQNTPKNRRLKITLTNGARITAEQCYEAWQQWGGTPDELYVAMPTVERHNEWLHGGSCDC